MRNLLQMLVDWLWPGRSKASASGVDPHAYLRPLIALAIVLLCGPEVFAAADLIALLDLLGTALFLTAFAAGSRAIGLAALARLQRIFFPPEWTVMLKASRHPSIVAHGILLIGVNGLIFSMHCAIAIVGAVQVVKAVV